MAWSSSVLHRSGGAGRRSLVTGARGGMQGDGCQLTMSLGTLHPNPYLFYSGRVWITHMNLGYG